jgi:hypothetical protein
VRIGVAATADRQLDGYGQIPVSRAALDRQGAASSRGVSILADETSVTAHCWCLADFGATQLTAILSGADADRRLDHLAGLAA